MPDARYDHYGTLTPITFAARTWLYQNTSAKKVCKNANHIPPILLVTDDVVDLMRGDGLIVN